MTSPFARPFTSLRYPFAIDTAQGEVAQERDYAEHVEQLIKQVLLTAPGERIDRPDFGCGVKRLVFAPGGEVAATLAQTVVSQSLNKWLGSVISVHEVTVRAVEARLDIRIGYAIRARGERRFLNLEVTV
jgi:phage baseplate assembly protein W